jgi:hypothetical protein
VKKALFSGATNQKAGMRQVLPSFAKGTETLHYETLYLRASPTLAEVP